MSDCFCGDINRGYDFYSGRNRVLKQGRGNGNDFQLSVRIFYTVYIKHPQIDFPDVVLL